uniref:Uncharacterized protein n=1 Tax=Picea sitchensis TaxID=3332 RepID=A9NWV2_PICSI|nr:unknown [Picea sitchensis]
MADEYICNPKDLHFTQESIKDSFSKAHSGVKLQDTVADIKAGKLDPSSWGPLTAHEGEDGRLWCENNRRLWVTRQADLPVVNVKIKSNDFISRRLGEETKEKLSDSEYLPKVRRPRP